jgi:putative oxidoreductase
MLERFEGLQKWGPVVLQAVLGFVFVMHWAAKLFGAFQGPGPAGVAAYLTKIGFAHAVFFWAWVVTLTEFFGGLCVLCGFLTRFWAAGLVIDMTTAILRYHIHIGFFWLRPGGGLEFPLTLAAIAFALLLTGPSFLSVDRALGLEKRTA